MSIRAVLALAGLLTMLLLLPVLSEQAGAQDKDKAEAAESGLPKELAPRPVTLDEKEIPLSAALAELAKQTGNVVEDRRKEKDDVRLRLELKKATFWQALDAIAKEADAKLALYERDGKVALVDGPHVATPASYSGLFRVGVKSIRTERSLDPDAHFAVVKLEVAWEPRFTPFFLEAVPDSIEVQDDKGNAVQAPEKQSADPSERGQIVVSRRAAIELDMRVPAPKRASQTFGVLKGSLSAVGPTKMLTFTFDKLGPIKKRAEALSDTKDGVTVRVRQFAIEGQPGEEIWTAELLLEYPADGPKFESFQSWTVSNEIYLSKGQDDKPTKFDANGGYETDSVEDTRITMRYRFTDDPDNRKLLGKPSDWKLVYRTPGRMLEVPVPFEFKGLPLP